MDDVIPAWAHAAVPIAALVAFPLQGLRVLRLRYPSRSTRMYALKRYLVRGSLSWLLVCTLWIGATYMIDAVLVNPESPWHVVSQSGGVVTYSRPRWGGDAGLAMIGGFVMLGTGISALVWLVCALDFGVRCPECKDRTIVFDHRRESETREGASGMPYYVSVEIWEMCCPKCHRREKLLSKPSPNFP